MSLRITTTSHDDGSATLVVIGEVDISNADDLRQAIEAVAGSSIPTFVDLTATTYLGSSGLQVLAEQVGRGVELVVLSGSVPVRVLSITALDRELVVHAREP